MTAVLPPARVAIAGNAPPSREWYRYFQAATQVNLDVGTLRHDVDALTVRVTALEDAPPSSSDIKITGTGSIYVSATAVKVVSLEGDAEDPGFTTYYGTDVTGAKGWYAVSDALASSGNIAKSTDAAGVTSFDLVDLADSGTGAALVKITRDAKGRVSGTSAATTTDLAEGTNLYFTDARADARITLQKAQPLGLATLDAAGKLDAGQLPALAITETFVVNTQAAMLALSAQEGDVAVRTDLSKSFILTAAPASTLANWQELLVPTAGVTSFNGRTGSVTPASGDYTPAQVGAEPAIAAGTTAQYWRGDKTWRDFATDVRAAVLTGLSLATSTVIAATDTVLSAFGKLQAQITDNLLPPGYIDGLQMQWVSATAITVASGSAYIAGSARVLRATVDIAKTSLSLSASTWYHVYLYDNAGTPDVEIVTTAPAAPYNGTARIKTGDASRRYLGSVRTGSDTAIYNFVHASGRVLYRENIADGILPFRVLSNGMSTTDTVISCTDVVPVTSKVATLRLQNTSTVGGFRVKQSDGTYSSGPGPAAQTVSPGGLGIFDLPLNSSQQLIYFFLAAPSSGGYIDVCGYSFDR